MRTCCRLLDPMWVSFSKYRRNIRGSLMISFRTKWQSRFVVPGRSPTSGRSSTRARTPYHRVQLRDLVCQGSAMKALAGADTAPIHCCLRSWWSLKNHRTNYVEPPCAGRSAAYAYLALPRLPRPVEGLSWTSDICERA